MSTITSINGEATTFEIWKSWNEN